MAELRAAYHVTLYCVQAPNGDTVLRHGQCSNQIVRALETLGVRRRWAIVTPCNPRSRLLTATSNRQRLGRFTAELKALGWRWHHSVNRDPNGCWPEEPGALLCDVPHAQALALAARYGQYAILTAPLRSSARLAWAIKP